MGNGDFERMSSKIIEGLIVVTTVDWQYIVFCAGIIDHRLNNALVHLKWEVIN